MGDVIASVGALVVFVVVPGAITVLLARGFARWCYARAGSLRASHQERGGVWGPGLMLRIAVIVALLPALLITLTVLLGGIGSATGDSEMAAISLRLGFVAIPLVVVTGVLTAFGLTLWIVDDEQLTRCRFGRERSIRFADMTRKVEGDPARGLMIHGQTSQGATRIRISKQVDDYGAIFNQLVAAAPALMDQAKAGGPGVTREHFRVDRWRLFAVPVGLLALLIVFVAWPWFVVVGEHRVRDSLLFVGIGVLVWLAGCFAVAAAWLQPQAPWSIELGDDQLVLRFLGRVESRQMTELRDVAVETQTITMRSQTGYRYPLSLHFTDGEIVHVNDARARHMSSSTHEIAAMIQDRYIGGQNPSEEN